MTNKKYQTFKEFYPYYLSEHKNSTNKLFHMLGSLIGISIVVSLIALGLYNYIPIALIPGYCFAWIGHFIFEKNKPATFKYPLYSFLGDWVMLKDIIIGKVEI